MDKFKIDELNPNLMQYMYELPNKRAPLNSSVNKFKKEVRDINKSFV